MSARVTVADTAGFCFGVNRAVKICEELLDEGKRVSTLGPIIHNPQMVRELRERGAVAVDYPSQAKGTVLVIRSHGVLQGVFDECRALGVETVDATCPFVSKIHNIVGRDNTENKTVLVAGDKNHPEVMGIVGHCASDYYIFDTKTELEDIFWKKTGDIPIILVAQTTFNLLQYNEFVSAAKNLYTSISVFDTICSATMARQHEATRLAKENDVCVVIGGHESSNTRKLADVCSRYARTVHVETSEEINANMFKNATTIGVTAGASTPARVIEEVLHKMEDIIKEEEFNFEQALENSMRPAHRNQRLTGIVTEIRANEVVVDIGRKQTGIVPADEMSDDPSAKLDELVKLGEEVNLIVIKVNDQDGIVTLSKKRVDSETGMQDLVAAVESGEIFETKITEVVEKGLVALVKGIRVFIPGSQATERRGEPFNDLLHKTVKIKILEATPERRRAIGSIRAVGADERRKHREETLANIAVGNVYKGVVKSLTSYGAFVDIGGVDGMVHVTELSWQRVKSPADVVSVGDEIEVRVIEYDPETQRISLGYRKPQDDPWNKLKEQFEIGQIFTAPVVSLTKFGAFVRLMDGIDGLVHISEMSDERVEKPSDVVKVGDEVTVKLIGVDYDKKRVSLTMKLEDKPEEEPAE